MITVMRFTTKPCELVLVETRSTQLHMYIPVALNKKIRKRPPIYVKKILK